MNRRIYHRDHKKRQNNSYSSMTLDSGMFAPRPFAVQFKMRKQNLKASLNQAECYGHHLDRISDDSIITSKPIQMLSALEEDESKLMSGMDSGINNFVGEKNLLDRVLNVKKQSIKSPKNRSNINNQDQKTHHTKNNLYTTTAKSTESQKRRSTLDNQEKTRDKNEDKHKSNGEHLTSLDKQKSNNTSADKNSDSQNPEVQKVLDREKNQLPPNSSEFIAPSSTYEKKTNTPPPKAKTRSGYLVKREAINTLNDNQAFATMQRSVKKVPTKHHVKLEHVKAQDNQQQVKLKTSAELVRDSISKDDKQVKENLRENFHLDPDIVDKEGGEDLILQKMQS